MSQKFTILFDLDGTLVNTAPALMNAHNHVMKKFGYEERELSDIKKLAGRGSKVMLSRSIHEMAELTGQIKKTDSKIEVITRTLRYKQTLFSNLHIDAFSSFSQSINTSYAYSFNFHEPDAYTESTFGIKMNRVENIAKFDTLNTGLDSYQYNKYFSDEEDRTYGVNLEIDFRIGKQLSGKVKIGNKIRTKAREFDRNNEYAPVAAAAGLSGPRDSLVHHFPQLFDFQRMVNNM